MNIGDKVKGVTQKYQHLTGHLCGDGMCEEFMYLRTEHDLISVSIDKLRKHFKIIETADTEKPIKSYCMFS